MPLNLTYIYPKDHRWQFLPNLMFCDVFHFIPDLIPLRDLDCDSTDSIQENDNSIVHSLSPWHLYNHNYLYSLNLCHRLDIRLQGSSICDICATGETYGYRDHPFVTSVSQRRHTVTGIIHLWHLCHRGDIRLQGSSICDMCEKFVKNELHKYFMESVASKFIEELDCLKVYLKDII